MHPKITLQHPTKKLFGTIKLPASKSLCNRALILNALMQNTSIIKNVSYAHDTTILLEVLLSTKKEINVGDAGTVARFLTAYYATTQQEKIITGSKRMFERPIGNLVDALRILGAEIKYLGNTGFLPIHIEKTTSGLVGRELTISGDVSSQFISALLMIAPILKNGLSLKIENNITSKPYILMTLSLMEHFGIAHTWNNNCVIIEQQDFHPATYCVEPDWSAASYWYSMAGLADEAEINLIGLTTNSLQGDSRIAELMWKLAGIETCYTEQGLVIKKNKPLLQPPTFIDFSDIPDLAQTIIVYCAAKNYPLQFTGIDTLEIKETKRISALKQELEKFGIIIETLPEKNLILSGNFNSVANIINTYNDHRMAMSFAPLALVCPKIIIENQQVVKKSYPDFWQDFQNLGFEIK